MQFLNNITKTIEFNYKRIQPTPLNSKFNQINALSCEVSAKSNFKMYKQLNWPCKLKISARIHLKLR